MKKFLPCNHGALIGSCRHRPRCEYDDATGQLGRWVVDDLDDDARAERVKENAYEYGFDHEELGR